MNAFAGKLRRNLSIIWAIAAKDILDGLKNKAVLSNVGMVLFLVVFYRLMPVLFYGNEPPGLALYDAGDSQWVAQLEAGAPFDAREVSSQENLERYLGSENTVVLGLVFPADFDQTVESEAEIELQGTVDHWVSANAVAETEAYFEAYFAELLGKPVHIEIAQGPIYTRSDSMQALLIAMAIIVTLFMLGAFVTPTLMLEEKDTKTLDALLVSPATAGQVAIGKAIAGLFYSLTAAALVLAFNMTLIIHWGTAVLATACGALFLVAVGLLLGSIFRIRQQLTVWGLILAQPLLIPVVFSEMTDLLPAGLIAVMRWIPTVALGEVLRLTVSGNPIALADVAPRLALVVGGAALVLAAVAWIVRRSDR